MLKIKKKSSKKKFNNKKNQIKIKTAKTQGQRLAPHWSCTKLQTLYLYLFFIWSK
jgi:hypothetical protein